MHFYETNKTFKIMRMLEGLRSDPYDSQYELAQKVGIVPGLVNRYIKEQEELGHIRILSENQRVKSYHVTDSGLTYLRSLKHQYYNEIIDIHLEMAEEVKRYLQEAAVPREIVLFGANSIASIISGIAEYDVLYIVDNNPQLRRKEWLGYEVHPVSIDFLADKTVIICSWAHSEEMGNQLQAIQNQFPGRPFRYIHLT
jgi:DNA-binding PadR family transcriptional regulator